MTTYRDDTKLCVHCGLPFDRNGVKPSHWAKRRFCTNLCSNRHTATLSSVRAVRAANGRMRAKVDPTADVAEVADRYKSGMTQAEIAEELGCSLKRVQGVMSRNGIKARGQVKRDQRGDRNSSWRGDEAGYQAFHLRVQVARGKPSECDRCGTVDARRSYDWANLTGHYEDIDDYQRMCRQCHRQYDNARRVKS